jgi:hypothetical protein
MIPATERAKTVLALDRLATVAGATTTAEVLLRHTVLLYLGFKHESCLLATSFRLVYFFRIFFYLEDGGDVFLRNVG